LLSLKNASASPLEGRKKLMRMSWEDGDGRICGVGAGDGGGEGTGYGGARLKIKALLQGDV